MKHVRKTVCKISCNVFFPFTVRLRQGSVPESIPNKVNYPRSFICRLLVIFTKLKVATISLNSQIIPLAAFDPNLCFISLQSDDAVDLNYTALHFHQRKTKGTRRNKEQPRDCVYSEVIKKSAT